MNDLLEQLSVTTIIVVIVVLAGAVVSIVNPDTLPFKDYLIDIAPLVGGLAVGRGIAVHGRTTRR